MSVIPQGAFAALQVHKNFNRSYGSKQHEEEDNTGTGFETKNLQEGTTLVLWLYLNVLFIVPFRLGY